MIDFHFWPTPNGKKVAIMLEESGLAYRLKPVNILEGEQFDPAFLEISPNNKIPAIVDPDGPGGAPFSLFESGAILQYLAEKCGRFMPAAPAQRFRVLEWLAFQVANVGPMFGQCGHFLGYAPEKVPYAIERYKNETERLYAVMDERLGANEYFAGEYSIADMAIYPWIEVRWLHDIDIARYPNVARWFGRVGERAAVTRAMALMREREVIGNPSDETREAFFGRMQATRGRGDG